MSTTIGNVIEWAARNYPEKTGLVYRRKNQSWTFRELDEKVNRFADSLKRRGVRKGDSICFSLQYKRICHYVICCGKAGSYFQSN